jgi:ATPase subunit of ABC transporter with duplicated ATPase domains
VLTATGVELRAGARLLLDAATFRIGPGDRVGLVGRNGAGKTTLASVLAGDRAPAGGVVERRGSIGYLPQDPRTGDLDVVARDRVLSGRGLDTVVADLRSAEEAMAAGDQKAITRYGVAQERLHVLGGYAAEAEASSVAASLGLPDRVLSQPLRTLSGGQRLAGRARPDPVQRG